MMTTTPRIPTAGHDHDVRRAWWSFLLFVPSFVAAFVTGEGLAAAFGYADPGATVPVGTALVVGLTACLVFALPTLAVWFFGHRAVEHGHPDGRAPVVVALTVSAAFLASNLVQLVALVLF
jgi:hypothetical protein